MLLDELGRIDPAARVLSIARADERRDEFTHFEMQMRPIAPVRVADRPDLLAAVHVLSRRDEDGLEVRIIGLHIFACAILLQGVEHDDDVAPAGSDLAGKKHAPIGDGEDRIAQVAVFAADAIQVVAEMAILRERLRIVGEGAVLAADGKIETCRRGERGQFQR